jgi:hypothetical protein
MCAVVSAPHSAPEDAALMARIAVGDETAFRRFADRHVGRMLRLAQSILGSAAEPRIDCARRSIRPTWRSAKRRKAVSSPTAMRAISAASSGAECGALTTAHIRSGNA